MVRQLAIIRLSGDRPDGVRRFISDRVDARSLAEGQVQKWVTVTRMGTFHDPRYGEFEITRDMLLAMVANFDADAYGQLIVIDLAHEPQKGAAGFVRKLEVTADGKLRALVEFTEYGVEAVIKRGFIYLSAEFHPNYISNETPRKEYGPTLLGAALTPRPVIKRLDPVTLSVELTHNAPPTYFNPKLLNELLKESHAMNLEKLIKKLTEKLGSYKLAEAIVKKLVAQFEESAKNLADESAATALMEGFADTGKTLAEQIQALPAGATPTINLSVPAVNGGMSEDAVKKLMEDMRKAEEEKTRKLTEGKAANVKLFTAAIDKAEGLSDDIRKTLSEAQDMITADMNAEQVQRLAEHQLKLGNQMAAAAKLAGMGWQPGGRVHVSVEDHDNAKALQETINGKLRLAGRQDLKLTEAGKESPFVLSVLHEFDRLHAPRIAAEKKFLLAAGSTAIGDTDLPVGFQRTVIREALSDLRVLELVQTLTDFNATTTTQIPYEQRDTSAVRNNGVVFEGQAIHRASVTQAMDMAYINPMKLAFIISNEVIHFSRASAINWDAYARNVESNARVLRELIALRLCNEMQRSADTVGATAAAGEAFDSQLTGANSIIKTTNYPIVRPHQQYDLAGNTVGSVENPIAVVLNGTTLAQYDGSNEQEAGTYYQVINYNLGYIQLVNQLGAAVTPADSGTNTLGYSYATNIVKFDLDVPEGTTLEKHLNGLLRAIGSRKSYLAQTRYIKPNFLLMAETLHDTATNAEQHTAAGSKPGTSLDMDGDLEKVKGVPSWATNLANADMGEERILIGPRGNCGYTIAKPFETGAPFETVDGNGRPTGQKQAYGEEYSAIKVPAPVRNRTTSVIVYSFTGR